MEVLGTYYDPSTHHAEDNDAIPPAVLQVGGQQPKIVAAARHSPPGKGVNAPACLFSSTAPRPSPLIIYTHAQGQLPDAPPLFSFPGMAQTIDPFEDEGEDDEEELPPGWAERVAAPSVA